MLSQTEVTQAQLYAKGEWALFKYESETGIRTYVRRDGTKIIFREYQPVRNIIAQNHEARSRWTNWHDKKHGAVVHSTPVLEFEKMKKLCGWDGVQYDRVAMNKLLNDPDYAKFRTGGGKLKTDTKKDTPLYSPMMAAAVAAPKLIIP